MNVERGFRRVVLTLSLAFGGAGLAVTVYDVYKTTRYVDATDKFVACFDEAEHWTPTMEDFKMLPNSARPVATVEARIGDTELGPPSGPPAEEMSDTERSRWTQAARNYRSMSCGGIRRSLPAHLDRAMKLWYGTSWLPLWATGPSSQSYSLALLPFVWGIIISTGVGALPWGLFYLTRWIGRGFSG